MATTPGSRRRDTDITGDDRSTLNPMQQPLGSMDLPGSRTADNNEVNMRPGETVRGTGNLGVNAARTTTAARTGRGFTGTFLVVAVVLVAAFLIALYFGNSHTNIATGNGTGQAPIANSTSGSTTDTTGSTTVPVQPIAPAGSGTTTGGTTAPSNP